MPQFLKQFLRHPRKTGSVTESGSHLCHELTKPLEAGNCEVIIELGTGSGAVTEAILDKKPVNARFIGFEINEQFATVTRKRCPTAEVINKSAVYLPDVIQEKNLNGCEVIISGLPWTVFSKTLQDSILQAAYDSLLPGGIFVTYAYVHGALLPSARRFQRKIVARFDRVEQSSIIWANMPPAVVYYAEKR